MGNAICSIDGCTEPVRTRGWCVAHYKRWWRTGDPHGLRAMMIPRGCTLAEAFAHNRPGRPPPAGIVWPWLGKLDVGGYGRLTWNHERIMAHRVSYELHVGPIPEGLIIRHKNDIRHDVNPNNMELGDYAANHRDMTERHRGGIGITHGCHKLTESQVREIRYRRNVLRQKLRIIAADFDISVANVSNIALGKIWSHLD